jgi:RNA polymerase sigma factor (sigma-70 family)
MSAPEVESDETLWGLVMAGDDSAFSAVFLRHQARVYRYARRVCESGPDAEDVAAMAFLEAWRRRGGVRFVDGSLLGWLLVTAANLARNQGRARRRYGRVIAELAPGVGSTTVTSDPATGAGERIDMERAFRRLSNRDQDVLSLCVLEGLPTAAVSEILGVPAGTVKSRLHRAKASLAALLHEAGAATPSSTREATS